VDFADGTLSLPVSGPQSSHVPKYGNHTVSIGSNTVTDNDIPENPQHWILDILLRHQPPQEKEESLAGQPEGQLRHGPKAKTVVLNQSV
jgi:hypothetical protein